MYLSDFNSVDALLSSLKKYPIHNYFIHKKNALDEVNFRNLINDKAIVAKIPYKDKKKELNNYTNSVALKNGWCWEIPLWDKMSVGYVHTNKFATEKEIEKEFYTEIPRLKLTLIP